MHPILNQNYFYIHEHVGFFKAANNYDIFNPDTQELILSCREENLGPLTKLMRFGDAKTMTAFDIEVRTQEGDLVLRVTRGFSFFRSTVSVFDGNERLVGIFKQKLLSVGGKFEILDPQENLLCTLKGKWTSFEFNFIKDNVNFAHVTKQWKGFGKEMFTTADDYILAIGNEVPKNHPLRILLLAAVLCVDMVLKE